MRGGEYKRLGTIAACVLLAAVSLGEGAQQRVAGFIDPLPVARLKQLFPLAVSFTPRGTSDPLYFSAYAVDAASPRASPIGTRSGPPISSRSNSGITATFTC